MFLSQIIINRRKELKISQIELAHGICTQATISKMERQGLAPSSDILVKICQRLELSLNDLFSEFNDKEKNEINEKIEKSKVLLSAGKFKEAEKSIDSINEKNAAEKGLINKINLIKADLAFDWKKDYDEAQFFFNWVLDHDDDPFENLLALNGLGSIYLQKDKHDLASYYFDRIDDQLIKEKNFANNKQTIAILFNLANFYLLEQNYKKSQKVIEQALTSSKTYKNFDSVDKIIYLKAYLASIDNKESETEDLIQQAKVFAEFNADQEIIDAIDYYEKNHQFKK
ncbi:helix-turn-helix domain-containing protein [Oenococcus alcoholitolerans]|uniref:helix-turn-helix domain-containing protein n=1 Tax=Oenococcus alcoholitolerans TaxID=931074 RepID=UPI003F72A053